MHPAAFASPGSWFRGNLHTHSDRSDGVAPAEQVIAAYRAAGYDFVVLTDHFESRWGWTVTDTAAARGDDFTTLLGVELSSDDWDAEDVFWVNAIGVPADFAAPASGEPHANAIRRAPRWARSKSSCIPASRTCSTSTACRSSTCTPSRRSINAALTWPDQAEGAMRSTPCSPADIACRSRSATMRTGTTRGIVGAWVEVRAERLEPDPLLQALKAGAYYSTQGPRIDEVGVEAGLVQSRAARRGRSRSPESTGGAPTGARRPTRREATLDLSGCGRRSGASR